MVPAGTADGVVDAWVQPVTDALNAVDMLLAAVVETERRDWAMAQMLHARHARAFQILTGLVAGLHSD